MAKLSRAMLVWSMGAPSRVMEPSQGSRPRMHLSKVVLPAPFSPNRPTISPGAMLRLTRYRAWVENGYFLLTLVSSSITVNLL